LNSLWPKKTSEADTGPALAINSLNVYYGRAHALQDIELTIEHGVLGVVGRNGMGKTTLCNAITGLVSATGSIKFFGNEILGSTPNTITRRGIAYVPQGRRIWPSLTVDETLRLVASTSREVSRVYDMFPRLAERKSNGGAQLSGGEQQMLAIGRALLLQPKLLVMDEPTEGLAPVIVEQVAQAIKRLSSDSKIAVLLVEQNLGVALEVADRVAVMVNGRIEQLLPASKLANDRELQETLLGVRSKDATDDNTSDKSQTDIATSKNAEQAQVFTVLRSFADSAPSLDNQVAPMVLGVNRWGSSSIHSRASAKNTSSSAEGVINSGRTSVANSFSDAITSASSATLQSRSSNTSRMAYIAGTFDTKSRELFFLRQCLENRGVRAITVDLSTSGKPSLASIHPRDVARHHPSGESAVFTGDRGSSVTAMALAFERFIQTRRDVGGIISAGGSGGTSLATPAMRSLAIGVPKIMVSTMASGDTRPYVGPSDITMMYSVTDVQGINRISKVVLANAANALAGMLIAAPQVEESEDKSSIGLTMFGVTTPCVQALTKKLNNYDCLVFHATGVGGQSMEKLVDSGLLGSVIDVTTTEIADEIGGGVLSAGPTRLDIFARRAVPYVGTCGALDMINFGPFDSVPERLKNRNLYKHNPNVTLMRTTAQECTKIGVFIAQKLNAMVGPVRFLLPEAGVSALDRPGGAFHDPQANQALFDAIGSNFQSIRDHKLIRVPQHINDEQFAEALIASWREINLTTENRKRA
jgi:uncharacterized protein (UPF0261 family)/ABC-type branched-subunit amino acid transport system ATPase component